MKNQREKGKSFKSEKELKINFQAFPYSENKFSLAGKYIFTVGKFCFISRKSLFRYRKILSLFGCNLSYAYFCPKTKYD